MKPCIANRKLIAWQVLNALDARQTRQLQAHLEDCADCRRYMAEMTTVTESLAPAAMDPDIQASESFYRKLGQKLQAAKPVSLVEILAAYIRGRGLCWRMAVPAVAALVFIGVILATWPQPPKTAANHPSAPAVRLASGPDSDLAPTLANYQRTAGQSMEKLDALLTRQGKRVLSALPSYTASSLSLANESF